MLSENEAKAILHYTEGRYEWINENLRKLNGILNDIAAQELNLILQNLPNYEDITHRGVSIAKLELSKYEEAYRTESIIVEPTFISTSRSELVASGFMRYEKDRIQVLFEIAGKTGKMIENYSKYPSEKEVLFAPNARFSVESIIYIEKRVVIRLLEV